MEDDKGNLYSKLKKGGALGILVTMFSGIALEVRSQVSEHQTKIAVLESENKNQKQIILEMKEDFKSEFKTINNKLDVLRDRLN